MPDETMDFDDLGPDGANAERDPRWRRVVAELRRELEAAGRLTPATFPGISPPSMEGEAVGPARAIARPAGARLLVLHRITCGGGEALARPRAARQAA